MNWNHQALSQGMSAIFTSAKDSLISIEKEMSGLDAQIQRLQAQVSNASNDASLLAAMAQSAADSGIYHLTLAPEQGAWASRVLSATGLPPRDAGAYCAVIANIVIAADLGIVTEIASTITEMASTVIPKAKAFLSIPALPALSDVAVPSIPEPNILATNAWQSATMGDLFPSLATEMADNAAQAASKGKQATDGLAAVIAKKDELMDQLTVAKKLVSDLENSNVFNFIALPEVTPSADWYTRLTAVELDSESLSTLPVSDGLMYSSGTVTVIIAPDYASLVSKFNDYGIKGL